MTALDSILPNPPQGLSNIWRQRQERQLLLYIIWKSISASETEYVMMTIRSSMISIIRRFLERMIDTEEFEGGRRIALMSENDMENGGFSQMTTSNNHL